MRLSVLLVLSAALVSAQAYRAPRTAYGQPSFEGIWQASATATQFNVEPHSPSLNMQGGTGVIVDPADGKIPYTAAARAKQQQNWANRQTLDPINKCYSPGVPRVMYLPFPFQILQRENMIVILSEYAHTVRNIFMSGEHLDGLDTWMGDSRGKWEGETLVVDVANNNNETWFDQSGNHHTDQMRVVERYTRTGPDTMTYEATFTDPQTFTRPWTMRLLFYRHQEPNYRVLEYECHAYMELEGSK